MVLAVDIDGCLADFSTAYGELLVKVTGKDLLPQGWKAQLAEGTFPTTWYWEREAGYTKEDESKVWKDYILKQGIFWEDLGAMEGATEVIKQLNKLAKRGQDIYYVTHRMGEKAKYQTEKWLYGLGMDYPTVILSGDKTPLLYGLGVNFFVDDKLETLMDICDKMHVSPKPWILNGGLYLKDAPYNKGTERVGFKRAGSVKEAMIDFGVWD